LLLQLQQSLVMNHVHRSVFLMSHLKIFLLCLLR